MRAKDIMTTPAITAGPDTSLKEIADLLVRRDISAVPIVDEDDELVGIVTEADVVRLQRISDPRLHMRPVVEGKERIPATAADVMSINVVTATEGEDVTQIARRMLTLHLKRIPVVYGKEVVGMVSRRDILKVLARADLSIQAEIQERLDEEVVLLGWVHVHVDDGVVTMTGPEDEDARRLARLLAYGVPGVVSVRFADEA